MGFHERGKYTEDDLKTYCFVCSGPTVDGFMCTNCRSLEPNLITVDHTQVNPMSPLGTGLCTLDRVRKHGSIGRYLGVILTSKKDVEDILTAPAPHYVVKCGPNDFLDASNRHCDSNGIPPNWVLRYVNHSCDPNCQLIELKVKKEYRVYIRSLRVIQIGEELTYDYDAIRLYSSGPDIPCACGTTRCRGTINRK